MSSLTLSECAVFAGRYQIVRCIAHGGMGAVYEVIHIETDRRRALKVILPSFLQSDEMRARFRQEARVTARIASENIVDVLDAGIDDASQMPFLVMELLEGEEIAHRLKRLGPLEPHETVTYLHQASLALDKTHRAAIVHRDLKPGNLFLTHREDGSPLIKVLDFGIAKLAAEGATGPATQLLGTPLYMAPEQFLVGARVTPAVDIFALGMIAFTLLTGKSYWHEEATFGASPHALYVSIMQGPREPASARAMRRGIDLPPAFDTWFAQVTALDPLGRFPTATSAITALGEVFGIRVGHRVSMSIKVEPERAPLAPVALPPPTISLAEISMHTVPPARPTSTGGVANSTTAAVSHAVPAGPTARGPSAALVLAAALGIAILGGSALLMRPSGSAAPAGSGVAGPSSEPPRQPDPGPAEPTPRGVGSTIPSVIPSVEPSGAPAGPISSTSPTSPTSPASPASPTSKTASNRVPRPKPTVEPSSPPASAAPSPTRRGPIIFD
jgi:serine/threonine-protein kinase